MKRAVTLVPAWSRGKLPQWDGEAATLCLEPGLHCRPHAPGSCISGEGDGDVTPVSELDFNSNEATAGSLTDQELMSAEGEDDEETLSADPCGSPPLLLAALNPRSQLCRPSTSAATFPVEALLKDMPSSSKNLFLEQPINKIHKDFSDDSSTSKKKNDFNSSTTTNTKKDVNTTQKNNNPGQIAGSRFTTTLVVEEKEAIGATSDCKSIASIITTTTDLSAEFAAPLVTKAKNVNIKPGFTIEHS